MDIEKMDIKKMNNQCLVSRYESMVAAKFVFLNDYKLYVEYANICYEIKQEILRRMNKKEEN